VIEESDEFLKIEAAARTCVDSGDLDGAVRQALAAYGEEVFSFLVARLKDDDVGAEIFAQACEDLLVSLATFQWKCSLRTWFYRIARSATSRYLRSPANQIARRVPLSQVSELADQIRSRTLAHLRSEVKDGVRALRDQLGADEQQLLMLRIDRDLGWNEIAEILDDEDDPEAIAKAAARLRQQFQKLKTRLRELAIAEGLIGE
jgi:RNA polymerase sigma-70 factor (ECF subfamily)